MSDSKSTILEKALSLIEDPKHWGQGYLRHGNRYGTRYCALGALRAASGNNDRTDDATHAKWLGLPNPGAVAMINDRTIEPRLTVHRRVVELFQKAIRKAKIEEGVVIEIPAEAIPEATVEESVDAAVVL